MKYLYTPSISEVKFAFIERPSAIPYEDQRGKAFDRWLNEVKAQAWDEGFTRGFYDPLAGADRDASESDAANPYRKGN